MKAVQGKRLTSSSALRIVPLEDLQTDPSYQRGIVKNHEKIVSDLDQNALGIILVGQREDGSLWIVDGLQRTTALKKLGKTTIRAEVFVSKGPEHEADIFRIVNGNRTKLKPLDLFKARLTAGEQSAWKIKTTVENAGFKIATDTHRSGVNDTDCKSISAVTALERIAGVNGIDGLKLVLEIVRDSWTEDKLATNADVIGGMSMFLTANNGVVDLERLIPRLRTTTPAKLVYSCTLGVNSRWGNVADVIQKVYRKKLAKKR